jgi:hypothetical protein
LAILAFVLPAEETRPERPVLEPELIAFIRNSVQSIWSLEVLLLLRRRTAEALKPAEIVAALRSSPGLISKCLHQLVQAGLVSLDDEAGTARFSPATPDLARLCEALEIASHDRPIAVRDAITWSPNDKLRNFSDAFRLKGPDAKDKDWGKDE